MHNSLVILAGGASSRMKNSIENPKLSEEEVKQSNDRSKALIGLGSANKPILDYVLKNAHNAGYKKVYIVIGEQGSMFMEIYNPKKIDRDFKGLQLSFPIQYIPEGRVKPFGTADALFQALEQYPELKSSTFTVCNSDNLYSKEAMSALQKSESPNAFIAYDRDALQFTSQRIARFAVAKLDEHNHLLDIVEKPDISDMDGYRDSRGTIRVSMNIFKFRGELLYLYLKNCPVNPERNEKELPTAVLNMLREYPASMSGIPWSEHVPDLTSKDDILELKKYLNVSNG